MEPVISLKDVSVRYRVPKERIPSLKEYAIRWLNGKRVEYADFWALRDIDLEVAKGEVLGIIGQNGAGKSTLLKVIARVMRPTKGNVRVVGKAAPLLELGAGFDMELTGRENVYLNGAILGFSRRKMDQKFERIVDFAELWDFIDAPLRTYSTGMVARLGFAIATDVEPDILLIDEVLAVGDERFRKKCGDRIREFLANGATVLLVSHSTDTVRSMCDRALWLEQGQVQGLGDARRVVYEYGEFLVPTISRVLAEANFHPTWVMTRAELTKLIVLAKQLPLVIPDKPTFADVSPSAWYYPYVETVYANGASAGYPDGTFRPHQTVTRGEAVTMAVILSGIPRVQPSESTFQDVKPDAWYFKYVETAHARGFIERPGDGLFYPDHGMTRAEAAALAVKLAGYSLHVPGTPSFVDVSRDTWYYPYVETACLHGLFGSQKLADVEISNSSTERVNPLAARR